MKFYGKEAHDEGYEAFIKGLSILDNPYSLDESNFDCWMDGWMASKIDSERKNRKNKEKNNVVSM